MSEGEELRNDALCNETPQEKLKECTCGNHIKRKGVHLIGCPLHRKQKRREAEPRAPVKLITALTTVKEVIDKGILKKTPPSEHAHVLSSLNICLPTIIDTLKEAITAKQEPCIGSDDFKENCFALRARIQETKIQTMLVIREHPVFDEGHSPALYIDQRGEMKANLKLAYRHLEDAGMRLGKALQAFDGGKSCYPR